MMESEEINFCFIGCYNINWMYQNSNSGTDTGGRRNYCRRDERNNSLAS